MALISINSTAIKSPSEYKVTRSDLDSSNSVRNESGVLSRERVRDGVYKIEAKWANITQTQLKTITDLIAGVLFTVEFYDPTDSSTHSATMYAGDRSAEMVLDDAVFANTRWTFAVNLIEY